MLTKGKILANMGLPFFCGRGTKDYGR